MIRKFSRSNPLYSAFASAFSKTSRMWLAALTGYLPANAPSSSPCLCPAFFLNRRKGTGFFFLMTSWRYVLAPSSVMPFIVWHTSLAALWDTLTSRPLAFTVFSGSTPVVEYPHFGMVIDNSVTNKVFKCL